jgi:AcrR family transcriptional regulator
MNAIRKLDPQKREDILQAARTLFKQKSFSRTSIAAIAEKAGVAHGTVYLYFPSKTSLVEALCENYLAQLVDILSDVFKNTASNDIIRSSVRASLEHAANNRDLVRLLDLHMHIGLENIRPRADLKIQCILGRKINEYVIKGQLRKCDPAITAELVGGFIEWITKTCFVWGDVDIERYEDAAVQMLRYALMVDPGPRE